MCSEIYNLIPINSTHSTCFNAQCNNEHIKCLILSLSCLRHNSFTSITVQRFSHTYKMWECYTYMQEGLHACKWGHQRRVTHIYTCYRKDSWHYKSPNRSHSKTHKHWSQPCTCRCFSIFDTEASAAARLTIQTITYSVGLIQIKSNSNSKSLNFKQIINDKCDITFTVPSIVYIV